jgi:hypothetical protein
LAQRHIHNDIAWERLVGERSRDAKLRENGGPDDRSPLECQALIREDQLADNIVEGPPDPNRVILLFDQLLTWL